ncbi:MAG TPA: hypothetical protein VNA16_07735, partial [Abditibacteriaceae bacterium]|nr:hypothetical protein [Abditibacteriaceae bacterium]
SGTAEELTHYFDNDAPAIDAVVDTEGWLKCPCCGWRFTIKDKNVWTGRRHKRCGQKINMVNRAGTQPRAAAIIPTTRAEPANPE